MDHQKENIYQVLKTHIRGFNKFDSRRPKIESRRLPPAGGGGVWKNAYKWCNLNGGGFGKMHINGAITVGWGSTYCFTDVRVRVGVGVGVGVTIKLLRHPLLKFFLGGMFFVPQVMSS